MQPARSRGAGVHPCCDASALADPAGQRGGPVSHSLPSRPEARGWAGSLCSAGGMWLHGHMRAAAVGSACMRRQCMHGGYCPWREDAAPALMSPAITTEIGCLALAVPALLPPSHDACWLQAPAPGACANTCTVPCLLCLPFAVPHGSMHAQPRPVMSRAALAQG